MPDHLTALDGFAFPLSDGRTLGQAILRLSNDDSDAGGCPARIEALLGAYRRFLALAAAAPGGTLTVSAPVANLHALYTRRAQDPGALEALLGTTVTLRRARRLPLRDAGDADSRARYRAAFGADPHPRIAPSPGRRLVTGLGSLAFISGLAGGVLMVVARPESPAGLVLSLLLLLTGTVSMVFLKMWHVPDAD